METIVPEYEIRLHKADGSLSIVMMITALGDADAKAQALHMLKDDITSAHIWRDLRMIAEVNRT